MDHQREEPHSLGIDAEGRYLRPAIGNARGNRGSGKREERRQQDRARHVQHGVLYAVHEGDRG